jgi:hypothetical protein
VTLSWSDAERALLERLDAAVANPIATAAIAPIVARVDAAMAKDPAAPEAWEPIPLAVYGGGLPLVIRSSWVFSLRAGRASGAERHPNSHQRMMSWRGHGDFQVHDGERWLSHLLVSDRGGALEKRWISIPRNMWHQGIVPESDWIVVSFHTVPANELIEERPSGADPESTRQRRYLEPSP